MPTSTSNGLTATNSQPAETKTEIANKTNSATSAEPSKAESTLRALLALAGHAVHSLKDGRYLVCKYGYSYEARDLDDLTAFAVRLGIKV